MEEKSGKKSGHQEKVRTPEWKKSGKSQDTHDFLSLEKRMS
jgi:hypothetical protein